MGNSQGRTAKKRTENENNKGRTAKKNNEANKNKNEGNKGLTAKKNNEANKNKNKNNNKNKKKPTPTLENIYAYTTTEEFKKKRDEADKQYAKWLKAQRERVKSPEEIESNERYRREKMLNHYATRTYHQPGKYDPILGGKYTRKNNKHRR